jgi:DNA-binding beta-propeller fold protein YncE
MQTIRLALAFIAAFAAAAPARAQLVVSANDNKQVLVDGVPKAATNPAPDSAAIIDLRQTPPKLIAEIEVPTASPAGPPASAAITPDEGLALISGGMKIDPADPTKIAPDNRICVIDLKSSPPKLLGTVEVGAEPCGIAITPDGKTALVANRSEGTVSVLAIDGKSVTKTDTIKLGESKSGPSGIAITPDGKSALVARDGDHFVSTLSIEGGKVQLGKRDFTVGVRPYGVTMHPSGRLAVVGNVGRGAGDLETLSVIDLAQNPPRAVEFVPTGMTPECPAFSPDGKSLAVVVMNGSNKPKTSPLYNDAGKLMIFGVDGTKLTKLTEAPIGHWSQGVVFSKDGKTLLVQNMVEKDLWVFSFDGKNLKDTGQRIKVKGGAASIGVAGVR